MTTEPELDEDFEALIRDSQDNWLPEETTETSEFKKGIHDRIRRRRIRDTALVGAGASAAIIAGAAALTNTESTNERAANEPAVAEFVEPQLAEPHLVAPTLDEPRPASPDEEEATSPSAPALEAVAHPLRSDPRDRHESDVWFAGPLGHSPTPTEWGDDYRTLGTLYAIEVEL